MAKFRYVTMPLMRGSIGFVLIRHDQVIQVFGQVYRDRRADELYHGLVYYIYRRAFEFY